MCLWMYTKHCMQVGAGSVTMPVACQPQPAHCSCVMFLFHYSHGCNSITLHCQWRFKTLFFVCAHTAARCHLLLLPLTRMRPEPAGRQLGLATSPTCAQLTGCALLTSSCRLARDAGKLRL